jgi:hypothetical protein
MPDPGKPFAAAATLDDCGVIHGDGHTIDQHAKQMMGARQTIKSGWRLDATRRFDTYGREHGLEDAPQHERDHAVFYGIGDADQGASQIPPNVKTTAQPISMAVRVR